VSEKKVQASARIQITVEFPVGGQVWNEDVSVEQVNRQAREAALEILARGLSVEGTTVPGKPSAPLTRGEIVGEPKIIAVFVERQS
jgi:hypothetical protein